MSVLLMGGDFTPADLVSVVGWFDPTSDDYVTTSGSNLLTMTDRIQGTVLTNTGTVPLAANADLGGARTMTFGGSSCLSNPAVPANYPAANGDEVLVIFAARLTLANVSEAPAVFFMGGAPTWSVGIVDDQPTSPPSRGQASASYNADYRAYPSNATRGKVNNLPSVQAWRATASGHELWINGSGVTLSPSSPYTGVSAGPIQIGRRGTPHYLFGAVGEVIIGKGASTDDRLKLEGYLAWRYGLAASLPSTHPYKNSPP